MPTTQRSDNDGNERSGTPNTDQSRIGENGRNRIQVNFQMNGASNLRGIGHHPPQEEAVRVAHAALNHPAVLAAIAGQRARPRNNSNNEAATRGGSGNPQRETPQTSQTSFSNPMSSVPITVISRPSTEGNSVNVNENIEQNNNSEFHIQSINVTPNNPIPVPQIQLSNRNLSNNLRIQALKAEPVPPHKRNHDNSKSSFQTKPIFDCGICFDVLEDPTTCSNCTTRFCYNCLSRVLALSSSGNNARCPTCRNSFTAKDLTRDHDFKDFMEKQTGLHCPNHGCNKILTLNEVKKHEAECPHVLMQCKYSSFGCKWTGPKLHLDHHHQNDCHYEKVSGFIEKYRFEDTKNKLFISQMQKQLMITNRHIGIQHNVIANMQAMNIGNIFHVLQLGYVCSCLPTLFLMQKDKWKSMYITTSALATVNNSLLLLPFFILCAKKSFTGLNLLLDLFSEDYSADTHRTFEQMLDEVLLRSFIALFGFIVVLSYNLDKQDATCWTPGIAWRDLVAISLMGMNFVAITTEPTGIRCIVLGLALCSSIFFPALIRPILSLPTGEPKKSSFDSTRALPVVFFGLRYSILLDLLDFPKLCDGIILMKVISHTLRFPSFITLEQTDCKLRDKSAIFFILISRAMYVLAEVLTNPIQLTCNVLTSMVKKKSKQMFLVLLTFLCVNIFTSSVHIIGERMGILIATNAKKRLVEERNRGATGYEGKSRLVTGGFIFFCTWCFSLLLVCNAN